ncbi:MAG TPA: prepilin-type N-terminal cleavage/methylation domain-containing protein [Candidatus Acidoferrales bacterium]|jgi:Tfp pilus assembly protein PilV|nr:prepilin-type N-terminal cleavage/methylation domain-containing protein [Candidatus Acidoferrales bacterium]
MGKFGITRKETGMSLLELLIACLVLTIGLLGAMVLIATTVANNSRNKWDSTATLLSQMTLEAIAQVPANATNTVAIVDCNPSGGSASHAVSTAGSSTGSGAPLNGNGDIDFSQAAAAGYSMQYYNCQASTGDRQQIYDVRWNVKTISNSAKLVTVSARALVGPRTAVAFQQPVSLKMIVGL